MIIALRPTYRAASKNQRSLIETVIGAALWYVPKPARAWTGRISMGALLEHHPMNKVERPKLSEEHIYPRKVAARRLLSDEELSPQSLAEQFRETYGRVHLISPSENKKVTKHQRADVFTTPEAAYGAAGIILVALSDAELRAVKQRDASTIVSVMKRIGENGAPIA